MNKTADTVLTASGTASIPFVASPRGGTANDQGADAALAEDSIENPLDVSGGPGGGASRGAEDMSSQAFALLAMPSEADKYAEAFETEESESVRFKLGDTSVETVDDEVDTPPISSDT